MSETITWHGHSNFQIACDTLNLVIDPFFTNNPKATQTAASIPAPGLVLVTHNHGDHVGDAVSLCQKRNATLLAVVGVADALMQEGIAPSKIYNGIGINIGGSVTIHGVTITMVEAFHTSETGAPVGYIIKLPSGYTIYHAGDTGVFGNMAVWARLYPIDLALLPVGGTFTMDGRQAALAAEFLQAKTVVPMHYGTFPALAPNADELKNALHNNRSDCRCVTMQPGQTLELPL